MDPEPYRSRLEARARARGFGREDAEDLAQTAIVRCVGANLDSRDPEPYLHRTLSNLIADVRRKRRVLETPDDGSDYPDPRATPPEGDPRLDLAVLLLRSLSPAERRAIEAHVSGASYAQAAAACGITVSAHRSRLNRGKARLRALAASFARIRP